MLSRRRSVCVLATFVSAALISGCSYKGEEPTKERDFAVSNSVQTAIGAAGSTFVSPIMTKWIAAYQQAHRDAALIVRRLGQNYSVAVMRQWLRDGVPPSVLETLH